MNKQQQILLKPDTLNVGDDRQNVVDFIHELCPWQIFFTGTFKGEFSEAATQRAFERFMEESYPGVSYFYVIESNPSRCGHHVHALMHSGETIWRNEMNQTWDKRFGFNKVEKIRSVADVEDYCTKHVMTYLAKGGGWWNVQLNNSDAWSKAQISPRGFQPTVTF